MVSVRDMRTVLARRLEDARFRCVEAKANAYSTDASEAAMAAWMAIRGEIIAIQATLEREGQL